MLHKIAGLAGLATICGAIVFGQTTAPAVVSGTVRSDGQVHAGASVAAFAIGASQPTASTITGSDGTYQLSVPHGVYRLEYTATGFATVVQRGVVLLAGTTTDMNVVLMRQSAAGPALPEIHPGEVGVEIATKFGVIILAIDTAHAPVTAANFLRYVDAGLYNGGRFHRATRPDNYVPAPPERPMMELIQGGLNPERRAEGFPPIPLERTSVTGLRHVSGTVSMARGAGADSATSDFFILFDDQPSLDFGGRRFDDGQGAAAFGRVAYGTGVARQIQRQAVQGQNLTPPVLILWASRFVRPPSG
jgi:peptidyl-prolyl cis-trans isomerase A (cyclophilin A)